MFRSLTSLVCLAVFVGFAAPLAANDVQYVEDFALAKDRAAALEQLVPRTEDWFYYHALFAQQKGDFEQADKLLKQWHDVFENQSSRWWRIQHRQHLLNWDANPDRSAEYLRQRLGLHFNHGRETGQKPDLPSVLNPELINRQRLTSQALRRGNLDGFEDSALFWLTQSDIAQQRTYDLLRRLSRPDYPGLVDLVLKDLKNRRGARFGDLSIHGQLLLEQLQSMAKEEASLLNSEAFVNAWLVRLQPSADSNWQHDAELHEQYLQRQWDFVKQLEPAFNSLKAHVLYHYLDFLREQGRYPEDLFKAYLDLPRRVNWIEPRLYRDTPSNHLVQYGQQFAVTMWPPLPGDQPLVEDYLEAIFVDAPANGWQAWRKWFKEDYLQHIFAATKIVHNKGDQDQWTRMLSPQDLQQLRQRVDLRFALTNPELIQPDEPVELDVWVKNVDKLIIKVFRINELNYYRIEKREIGTDINLDGLVANDEQTIDLSNVSDLHKVKRHFEFEQLDEPGVYVVEIIGGGKSSRALIRKGRLTFWSQPTAAGHAFTVLGPDDQILKDAAVFVGGKRYGADEQGRILVPFTAKASREPVILVYGDFATLAHFRHASEQYKFQAGFHLPAESLLPGKPATLIILPTLQLNGHPVPIGLLEDVRLIITATDLDGSSSTQTVNNFKLEPDKETTHTLQTPRRLRSLNIQLVGQIERLSDGEKVQLTTSDQLSVNGVAASNRVESLHLLRDGEAYIVELRGLSGEPRPDRLVNLALKHEDFKEAVNVTLQTDAAGRIQLGPLPRITSVNAGVQGGGEQAFDQTWPLRDDDYRYPSLMHGKVGLGVRVPYLGDADAPRSTEFSLIERRGGHFAHDRLADVTIQDGYLVIKDVPAGDYDLLLRDANQRIQIRLADGVVARDRVISDRRMLEVHDDDPMHLTKVETTDEQVRLHVAHATKATRVHVVATRYVPHQSIFRELAGIDQRGPSMNVPAAAETIYLSGRQLSEEYQYILNRKYAPKYPGNMLDQARLLLNPWALRETESGEQVLAEGEEYDRRSSGKDEMGVGMYGVGGKSRGPSSAQISYDFLAHPAVVRVNLQPDENGVITIDREELADRHHLHIVAIDPSGSVYRNIALPAKPIDMLDLRLRDPLDSQQHFTLQKQLSVIADEEKFTINDPATAEAQAYDTVGKLYTLYLTLISDPVLREFRFIADWHNLDEAERRSKYSAYACHELNLFLYHKDRPFFDQVIRPYLANKKDKTFIDHWLLEADLSKYLEPWAYHRLNMAERALLAHRVREQQGHITRQLQDLQQLQPPDRDRFEQLFRTALMGGVLDVSGGPIGMTGLKPAAPTIRSGVGDFSREDTAHPATAPSSAKMSQLAAADPAPGERRDFAIRLEGQQKQQVSLEAVASDAAEKLPDDVWAKNVEEAKELRQRYRRLYRELGKTKEWIENNYYHLEPTKAGADLVKISPFWVDYALHDPAQPFFSEHFLQPTRNSHEALLALAVIDLPFEAAEHQREVPDDRSSVTVTAASPMLVAHQQIRPAQAADDATPILVSENFFRHNDRYRYEAGERHDKFVTAEFLVHAVYGAQVVVTNPTSSPQKLDVLVQIPEGAIPVLAGKQTRSVTMDLQPYHTQTLEYHFYFPAAGEYAHFPVHVSQRGQLLASGEATTLKVVAEPSAVDTESWDYISQHGNEQQVIDYLTQRNLQNINLSRIAWRMKDADFFARTTQLLAERKAYDNVLWSYAIHHQSLPPMRQYLKHQDRFVKQVGPWLDSKPMVIEPVARHIYQHKEYRPLVNARIHQVGREPEILNPALYEQYHELMEILSLKPQLDSEDRLAAVYYLLAQDRVTEALAMFDRVQRDQVATAMQYDYTRAYIDFYQADLDGARQIAQRYADHPVDRWRELFGQVLSQIDEIQGRADEGLPGDPADRQRVQDQLAATEPTLTLDVADDQVTVHYQNIDQLQVNYYLMDIELLFSRQPFVEQSSEQFAFIAPNLTRTVNLEAPAGNQPGQATFDLPDELKRRNVVVEVQAEGIRKMQPHFSNQLNVQLIEQYGQLRLSHADTGKPYAGAYVKVYARLHNGQVEFYKDGYTDLRGRFDYSSLNTGKLGAVQRFSILVLTEDDGASVREADVPHQ